MNRSVIRWSWSALLIFCIGAGSAQAAKVKSSARSSVNVNKDVNRNVDRDVNRNVNRDVDIDIDRDIDIDVDYHYDHGCCYHPIAAAAVVTTAVVATAAVIGSIVYSVPPSCAAVAVNGISYQQCGSTWYQPQFVGTSVTYVVVAAPR